MRQLENPAKPLPSIENAAANEPDRLQLQSNFRPWIATGAVSVFLVLGTLSVWAVSAPIASAVIASGQVTVDTNRKQVAHLEGGVVERLLVRNGDRVDAGAPLIRLDETRARARLQILRGGMDENVARLSRLKAEASKAAEIAFPDDLLARGLETGVAGLIAGEKEIFEARRLAVSGEIDIFNRRIEQLRQEIVGLSAQLDAERRRKAIIDEEVASLEPLLKKGLVGIQRVLALRREAVQMEGSIGAIGANIARSEQAMGETRLQILQREKEVRQEVLGQMAEAQSALGDLREQYAAAEDVLYRIEMTAPVSGTVVGMTVHSKGAVVKPGETVLEIVPDRDALVIEAQIEPQNVDDVAFGQEATVRIAAFKQRTTPLLHGRVAYVSADTLTDGRTGAAYYIARVAVGTDEIERLGSERLTPGMPAEVMIATGSRTAADYLIQPIVESMNKAWREN